MRCTRHHSPWRDSLTRERVMGPSPQPWGTDTGTVSDSRPRVSAIS